MTRNKLILNALVGTALVVLNVGLFNWWLSYASGARVDLTEDGLYSLSDVTKNLMANLDEDVLVTAYFSPPDKMMDEILPLIPEIKDLLLEYAAVSDGRFQVEFAIPESDEAIANRARDEHGVEPFPYFFEEKTEQGFRSFYFAVVVQYAATSPVTLDPSDFIDFPRSPDDAFRLGNLEFALTRAIKRSIRGFDGKRELFDRYPYVATITSWVSADEVLPESFKGVSDRTRKVLDELANDSQGKITVAHNVIGSSDDDLKKVAAAGIQPGFTFKKTPLYLLAVVDVDVAGRHFERPFMVATLDGARSEFALREMLTSFFERQTPGVLPTVGVAQHKPPFDPMQMQMGQRPPPGPFDHVLDFLADDYETLDVDLASVTEIPENVDVLIVMAPKDVPEATVYAIDQFLMRGKSIIVCADRNEATMNNYRWSATASETGLEGLLEHWGVTLSPEVVADTQCGKGLFGLTGRRNLLDRPWPYAPMVLPDDDAVNSEVSFLKRFGSARMRFTSSLDVTAVDGIESTWLLRSSENSWDASVDGAFQPNPPGPEGFAVPKDLDGKRRTLATLLSGAFASYYTDRPVPGSEAPAAPDTPEGAEPPTETARASGVAIEATDRGKVILVANDGWLDRDEAGFSRYGPLYGAINENARVLNGMVDWLMEDDDLLSIRNRRRTSRPLEDTDSASTAILWNFGLPPFLVILLWLTLTIVRRMRSTTLMAVTQELRS